MAELPVLGSVTAKMEWEFVGPAKVQRWGARSLGIRLHSKAAELASLQPGTLVRLAWGKIRDETSGERDLREWRKKTMNAARAVKETAKPTATPTTGI